MIRVITFTHAREILERKHRDACLYVHELAIRDPKITNTEWEELVDARRDEKIACENLFRLNWVEGDVK